MNPSCPYCELTTEKVSGEVLYPHRPDLYSKLFYLCKPCDAYVGSHPETGKPLGTPANNELRVLRSSAHREFDPLWKSGNMSRTEAYRWLSGKMNINYKDCHIGQFNMEQCLQVIDICSQFKDLIILENES